MTIVEEKAGDKVQWRVHFEYQCQGLGITSPTTDADNRIATVLEAFRA